MSKGKFSSKNRENSADVYALLAQREANKKKKPAAEPLPSKLPAKQPPRENKIVYTSPRQGRAKFTLGCVIFVLVFYLATFVGLWALRNWLVRFEQAQPTVKCEEVFQRLFANPDWEELYALSDMDERGNEGVETFKTYMEERVGAAELSYMETSAGLSGDKKYVVRLGDEKLATFTLTDKNKDNNVAKVPDWQLSGVEFFLEWQDNFRIVMDEGCIAYVNGAAMGEEAVVALRISRAEDYLPVFAQVPKQQVVQVGGLLTVPDVYVLNADGQEIGVTYDEESRTFLARQAETEIPEDLEQLALDTVKTYALYMSGKANANQLAKYFDRNSDTYSAITKAELTWVQKGSNYTFTDESVTDYRVYGEDLFSVRVSVNLNITRTEDGSVRENVITQSLFFARNSSDKLVCYEMTAVDVGQWKESVKLTFLQDGQVLEQQFVSADAETVNCPVVTAPEGKTFSGWVVETQDESGKKALRVVFTPDETGLVTLTGGTVLEPMTLMPLFE